MNSGEGLIYKSTGSWYLLRDKDGRTWNARVRGKLKIDDAIAASNPVAVGDVVFFDVEEDEANTAMIRDIKKRKNYIVRVSPHNRHHKHVVSANLDCAIIIATLAEPRTSNGFIDRFMVTAEAYHIPVVLVVNKQDLHQKRQEKQLAEWKRIYGAAGYEVIPVSALNPASVKALRERIGESITLFSGHSGVGKSTLINALLPELNIKTMELSDWSGKGQHTTTFAEMYDLPGGGKIIDTPGVKEFGLIDMERGEVAHYFPEMLQLLPQCRFNNCIHINEPGCAVKAAVQAGTLSSERYNSYLSILDTLNCVK